MSLVSTAEYETLTGSSPAAPSGQVEALLEAASSAVLTGAHGQNIIQDTYTDVVVFNRGGRFVLPQRPVTDVAAVEVDGVALTEGTDFRFTAGGNRRPAELIRRVNGADSVWTAAEAIVTFTGGWAPIPGQITMGIVTMVSTFLASGGAAEVTQEANGTWSASFEPLGYRPDFALPAELQATLDRLCGLDRDPNAPGGGSTLAPQPAGCAPW